MEENGGGEVQGLERMEGLSEKVECVSSEISHILRDRRVRCLLRQIRILCINSKRNLLS